MDATEPRAFRASAALQPAFFFVGGQPALDFVNTLAASAQGPLELLHADADLWRWARTGLPGERLAPERASRTHLDPRVRALRSALHALVLARIERRTPPAAALAQLNSMLAEPERGARLAHRAGRYAHEREPLRSVRELLACLARSAAALLVSGPRTRLRRCAGPGCVLVFADVSKAGRRRWCSMSACGNRAKSRAHRQRGRARSQRTRRNARAAAAR